MILGWDPAEAQHSRQVLTIIALVHDLVSCRALLSRKGATYKEVSLCCVYAVSKGNSVHVV